MSDEIGVALVNYACPICGETADTGIIMNQYLTKSEANKVNDLNGKTVGYADHACEKCVKYNALYIISIDIDKSTDHEPYRTGHIVGIKKDCDLAKELEPRIIKLKDGSEFCMMDEKLGEKIGLWK